MPLDDLDSIIIDGSEEPTPIEPEDLFMTFVKKIPFFSGILKRINMTGSGISRLVKMNRHSSIEWSEAVRFNQGISFALNIVDFLAIPLLYIMAFSLGEKVPFTLTNNAKWAYAGILLALAIVSILIPPLAPIMAVTSAVIVFTVSSGALGYLLYQRGEDRKELADIEIKITNLKNSRKELITTSQRLKIDPNLTEEMVKEQILENNNQKSALQSLVDRKHLLSQNIKNESLIINRSFSVILSATMVAGAVTSLFFPPIGAIVLIVVGLSAGAYVLTQFVIQLTNGKKEELVKDAGVAVDQTPLTDVNKSTVSISNQLNNSALSNQRPAACPQDPEILLNTEHSSSETERTGSRGQAAGRRDLQDYDDDIIEPNNIHKSHVFIEPEPESESEPEKPIPPN